MREHSRRRGLAVRPGDSRNRDARRRTGREQHVDDRTTDIARRALARCDVHAEAGTGIHFADGAACLAIRQRDVLGKEIHATDVQPDRADSAYRHFAIVRVDRVGHVDGRTAGRQVRRRPQVNDLVLRRHRILVVADLFQQAFGLVVKLESRQYFLVPDATARVLVDDIHQLFDRMLAVADDVPGLTLGRCYQLAVDDQQTMIEAVDIALDDDGAAVLLRLGEPDFHFFRRLEIDRYAAAVVSGERLHHHREADRLRRAHRIARAAHDALLRHRQAEVAQDAVGLFLVACELHRNIAGAARRRRLDASLEAAVPELHEAVTVQP